MTLPLTTERAVGILGRAIGAPVPEIALVDFSALLAVESQLSHFLPTVAHGSNIVPNVRDRRPPVEPPANERNRRAYAALAVLYGWFQGGDHQWLVTLDTSDVYSADHGHFLPGGPAWSSTSLATAGEPAPDQSWSAYVRPADLTEVGRRLAQVSDEVIAAAVAQPLQWGAPIAELVALCSFLSSRRDKMIGSLGG